MQLVAVQMRFDLADYRSFDAFRNKIDSLMQQAARKLDPEDDALVAFPEDVGLPLVLQGLEGQLRDVTALAQAIGTVTRRNLAPLLWLRLRHRLSWVPALFLHRHEVIAGTYFTVFSEMARRYGVWLAAGSAVLPPYPLRDGEVLWHKPLAPRVYNCAYLFDPSGKVVGRQDKVHLIDLEQDKALDLASGDAAQVRAFPTPFGKVGIAICLDAFEDDVIDALVRDGAQILVQPSANPGPWTPEQQTDWLRSSYARTYEQGRFAYAVNPMMHGNIWDVAFYGQSSIVVREPSGPAQYGYTDLGPMPGFAAVAAHPDREEILVVKVPPPAS